MKHTHIIFDLDGTLFNSISTILSCFKQTFEDLELPYPSDEKIAKYIGSSLELIWIDLVDAEIADQAIEIYRKNYIKAQNEGIPLVKGAKNILKRLKEKGKDVSAYTMKKRQFATPLLESVGINEYFSLVVGSEDVEKGKPDPEGLNKMLEAFGINSSKAVYIGDSLHDAHAAKNANMDFLGVLTGTMKKEDFHHDGFTQVFPSIKEAGEFLLGEY